MAIEAPLSKYKKANCKLIIAVCLGFSVWCIYDGYFNQEWIEKHADSDGNPDSRLVFNQKAPYYLFGTAAVLAGYLLMIYNKKLVADENELVISANEKIPYDAIQSIDKTSFDSKGYFVVMYNDKTGKEVSRKLSDRKYDNLGEVLERLVAKIS